MVTATEKFLSDRNTSNLLNDLGSGRNNWHLHRRGSDSAGAHGVEHNS
jgi:hypothetical protein